MKHESLPKAKTDPRDLRVIRCLIREGFESDEVCRRLKISRATYYRRLAEIRRDDDEARRYVNPEVLAIR